jgi:hypothetical protein
VTTGWGTADKGGAWAASGANAGLLVTNGAGSIQLAKAAAEQRLQLGTVSLGDVNAQATFGFPKLDAGGSIFAHLATRASGWGQEYRAKLIVAPSGAVQVETGRVAGGAETSLGVAGVPGLTVKAGDRVNLRFQAQGKGTTTLRVKAWKAGAAEPADWQLTRTDSTAALQQAGAVGVGMYLSSKAASAPITVTVANFAAAGM